MINQIINYYNRFGLKFFKKTFFPINFFGLFPKNSKEYYLSKFEIAKKERFNKIDEFEKIYRYKISSDWINNLALITQVVDKKSEINYQHGRVLYTLLTHYIKMRNLNDHITILETGTARGFSAICMSKSINDLNAKGKIITLDFLPHNREMYWNCISDIESKNTRESLLKNYNTELSNIVFIQCKTNSFLNQIGLKRINFAFLDGSHTKIDVIKEFEFVSSRQIKGDIILFDDYTPNHFNEVVEAIDKIKMNKKYLFKTIFSTKDRGYVIAVKN